MISYDYYFGGVLEVYLELFFVSFVGWMAGPGLGFMGKEVAAGSTILLISSSSAEARAASTCSRMATYASSALSALPHTAMVLLGALHF